MNWHLSIAMLPMLIRSRFTPAAVDALLLCMEERHTQIYIRYPERVGCLYLSRCDKPAHDTSVAALARYK